MRTDEQIAAAVTDMGRAIMQAIDMRCDHTTEEGFADASSGLIAAFVTIVHGISGQDIVAAESFAAMIATGVVGAIRNGHGAGMAADMKQRN